MAYDLPRSLSPSAMSTFEQCPKQYQYSRIDKLPTMDTEPQLLGTFVHEVLEGLYGLRPERRTLEWCRDQMTYLWSFEYKDQWATAVRKDGSADDFKWRAWWALENYFALENPVEITPAGLETKFEAHIGDVPVNGIIDRWHEADDEITVVDYKTGKPPNPRYEDKTRQQLLFYALAMSDLHRDKKVTGGRAVYVKTSPAQVYDYELTDETSVEITSKVESAWAGITKACETEDFPVITSRLCGWCDFQDICPAWT